MPLQTGHQQKYCRCCNFLDKVSDEKNIKCYIISFCTDLEEQNSHLSSCLRFLFIVVGKVLNITVGKKPSNLHLRYVML